MENKSINCPYCGRTTHTAECAFCHVAKHMDPATLRKIAKVLEKTKAFENKHCKD